ncbi:MAG: ATPase domain-containing protein [Candidatus Micrarchaeota archaeon]
MALGVNEEMPILKANRLSSGIPDLDILLEGGYFNPGNIVMIGPSGMEKAAFAYHFAASVGANENAYIICGNSSPADIINKASTLGLNLNKPNIFFIDCYSATLGKPQEGDPKKIKIVMGPGALNDISLMINEATQESTGKKMRVIFDTLSTFVLYNPQDSIRKFLGVIEGRLKGVGATAIYLVDEGVHDKQVLSLIAHGMDETYTIADQGGKFVMILPELDMPVPIKVGPAGVTIL